MVLDSLDHVVLTVADVGATCDFYARVLGMRVVTFAEGRTALAFGAQKINLHQTDHKIEPKAENPTPGSADLCFLTATPLPEVVQRLAALQTPILEGPVRRTGASGPIQSVYVRDPDGNLIEIANIETANREAEA